MADNLKTKESVPESKTKKETAPWGSEDRSLKKVECFGECPSIDLDKKKKE
jgi:hypothetical protein